MFSTRLAFVSNYIPPFSEIKRSKSPAEGEKKVLTTKSAVNTNTPTGTFLPKRIGTKLFAAVKSLSKKKAPSEASEVVRFPSLSLNASNGRMGRLVSMGVYALTVLSNFRVTLKIPFVDINRPVLRVKGVITVDLTGCPAMLRLDRRPSIQMKMHVGDRIVREVYKKMKSRLGLRSKNILIVRMC